MGLNEWSRELVKGEWKVVSRLNRRGSGWVIFEDIEDRNKV